MFATELIKAIPLAAAFAPRNAVGRFQNTGSEPEMPKAAIAKPAIANGALGANRHPRQHQTRTANKEWHDEMPHTFAGAVGALREQDHPDHPGDRRHRVQIADGYVAEAERLEHQRQEETLAVDAKAGQQRDAGQYKQLWAHDRPPRPQMPTDRSVAFGLQLVLEPFAFR